MLVERLETSKSNVSTLSRAEMWRRACHPGATKFFQSSQPEAMLLIDAENAFNSLNGKLTLKNTEPNCLSLINALRDSSRHLYLYEVNCQAKKHYNHSRYIRNYRNRALYLESN